MKEQDISQDAEDGSIKHISFDEALVLTGQGKFHYFLQLVCGLCLMAQAMESLCTGYILPSAQCDMQLTTQDMGLLNAICYIAMVCSSHLWGFLADTQGRRKTLMLTLTMDSLSAIASSFAHSFWLLLILRFCSGFFICGAAAVMFPYLGEFHSQKTRGRAVVWSGMFYAVGTLLLPGIAWGLIPLPWSFDLPWYTYKTWRLYLIVCCFPGLLATTLMAVYLPESPKFLLASGKENEAIDILRNMYVWNTGNNPEKYLVKQLQLDESPSNRSVTATKSVCDLLNSMWEQTKPLFLPPHLFNITLCCIVLFGIFNCCNGLLLWLPVIFNRMSIYKDSHANQSVSICEAIAQQPNVNASNEAAIELEFLNQTTCTTTVDPVVFQNTLVIGATTVLAITVNGYLVPYIEKRNILISALLISGMAGLILQFMEITEVILGLASIFVAVSMMCVGLVNSISVDLFPTHLRAMAVSLSLMSGRLGGGIGSMLIGYLLELSCPATFYALSCLVIVCGFMSCLLPNLDKHTR